jgi:hypothetical protein
MSEQYAIVDLQFEIHFVCSARFKKQSNALAPFARASRAVVVRVRASINRHLERVNRERERERGEAAQKRTDG